MEDGGDDPTVLVVDSDGDRRRDAMRALEREERIRPFTAATVEEAKQLLREEDVDCIVSAAYLDDGAAVDVFRAAAQDRPAVGRIIFDDMRPERLLAVELNLVYGHIDSGGENAHERLTEMILEGYDRNAFAPYPVPEDEEKRLAVLEELEVEASEALRQLVERAADYFDIPKASIRAIEREEQRYVTAVGFDADTLPRKKAVCTYTIMEDEVLVVENLQSDSRFSDVDFYREHDIDWYAGAVITVDGHNIGTFCLEDSEQHTFTEEDKQDLKGFADHAAILLAARQHLRQDGDEYASMEDIVRAAEERAGN